MLYDTEQFDPAIESLEPDVALRVARLVVECSAPVDLAIAAVEDARTHDNEPGNNGYEWPFLKRLLFH